MGNIFAFLTSELKREYYRAKIYFYDHDFETVDEIANSFSEWIEKFNDL
jgi:hypothetical protein